MGSWKEAIAAAEKAFERAGDGPAFFAGKALWLVAEIFETAGNLERAEHLLSQALGYLTVSPADQISCAALVGLYRSRLGNHRSAEAAFDYALQILKGCESPMALRRAFRDARIAARVGRQFSAEDFAKLQTRVMRWKASPA
jgi:tetratricopeptide (TPR) repeat protein